jgi:predicted DNA-binding protein
MNLEELKKLREKNFSKHKEKKRAYYLKSKIKKEIDYEDELKDDGFLKKMQEIVKVKDSIWIVDKRQLRRK